MHDNETSVHDTLTIAGFTTEEATVWARAEPGMPPLELLRTARAWQATGMPVHDAVRWHIASWHPGESTAWWLHGFTTEQATFVERRLQASAPQTPDGPADDPRVDEWLTSGLPPDDIVLCVAADRLSVDSAAELIDNMSHDPALRGTLRLQAALRGADLPAPQASR